MESLIPESAGVEIHSSPSNGKSTLRLITAPSPSLSGRKPGRQMRMWKRVCVFQRLGGQPMFFSLTLAMLLKLHE